ncbi:YbjN domain-containing protein [Leucobacter sp. HNU]|uniref:YbjN domain-containing protein n=1 Tax=Leucobacter sp. HNU TaxID=3236805 RepID=UPI003A81362B
MGFFTKEQTPAAAGGALAPLSKDRVKHALENAGWQYRVDSDGDIGGGWENGFFYFFVNGEKQELFCVRGTWYGELDQSDFERALVACNTWNTEKLWPKTYARPDDEGKVRVHCELNVDYEHGLTDEQLMQHLLCVINTGGAFFESLNEQFPEAAAAVAARSAE